MLRAILILGKRPGAVLGRAGLTVCVAALLGAACSPSPGPAAGAPLVVATTSILGDLVSRLAGDDLAVEVLIPAGTDPHDFEASARAAARLRDAVLVAANGLGLEEGLEDALAAAASEGVPVLEIAPFLDPLPAAPTGGTEDAHSGGADPHVWHDPVRMAAAVELIAGRLAALDTGVDAAAWETRAGRLAGEILAAHDRITAELSTVPPERRKLVTNHDTFRYFAERYGFEVVGVVIPGGSTLAEPSAAELAGLVEAIRRAGVTVLFAENVGSSRLLDVVAAELGSEISVVELFTDSLGPPGSDADTYLGMIESNAARIAGALG